MNNFLRAPRFLLFVIFLLITSHSFGQGSTISGKVTDENNEPLTGAVAELRNVSDSTLAKVNVADAKGVFSFDQVKSGNYYLKTSLLGFTPYKSESFAYDGTAAKELKTIKMPASAVTLQQANVTALKPLIEVRPDKTVFNVESSINSTGSTAYELLQKAPGVVVDNNDNVMLKGRGGVLIQIDGRNTQLSEQDLADYLKTIQSTDVESIEIISNPSSKYDAEGTAGIINIKLKKNKNFGTNGSVTLGYAFGDFSKYNTALSLNNRSKNFNIYGNYGNNWGQRKNEFYLYREQYPYIFDASSIFERWGLSHNYKVGVDYTINKKHTIGTMVNGNYANIHGSNTSRNYIHGFETGAVDSILKSDQTVEGHANNIAVNLNHHFADTLGHDLMTDFDYGYYEGMRDNYQPNVYTLPDNETILTSNTYRTQTPTTIGIYTLKSDYTQNLFKGKLGAGYKVSFVKTDNIFDYYHVYETNQVKDTTRSNQFEYTENVYAAYLNYQIAFGKFDLQAGLRAEHTYSFGDLVNASDTARDAKVKREYTDYFPSGGVTFNANQNNAIGLIYSKRIDRPNYQELNPFEFKLDELSFRKGNPFLNPQYSDKLEVSHTYKYTTTTSVGYSKTREFFAQITDTLPGGKSFISSRNLATEEIFSVNVSSSLQLIKWYGLYVNVGVYNQKYHADFGDTKVINTSVTNFNLYAQNTFKLPADFTFEVSGWYNSAGVWGGSYVTEPQGSLDLGLQKKLFAQQGTLKLSYSDLLHTAPWDSHNVYAGIVIRAHGNWESQVFRVSFSYRFGNKQMKGNRQRSAGSENEQNRIGGGE